ncbi:X-ray radiation resistance-associated protein 1-like [Lineus longissimus]|uniref:X-ray radiation resistance-associated protein 1-like n=1 Tax=Lineus longissimus TaxID=88925 RepID=UPI002B4F5D5E
MAATGIKFDDGIPGFASNCFPVRSLLRHNDDDGEGAWLVAHRAEQRRRFKAVLCTKPKSYSQIKEERLRLEREEKDVTCDATTVTDDAVNVEEEKVLDGFFLMKHCCVDDPSDLCSVSISGQGLSEVKEEDFALFDNVAYVNASENYLPLEAFKGFPIIRELEITLNGLRGIKLDLGDFPKLEILDLSYNNLSVEDILPLGLLANLKVLHLTGNGFRSLPPDFAKPHVTDDYKKQQRFQSLEILMLDDNRLSDLTTFAALAALKNLKVLNLSKNEIYSVPQLQLVEGRRKTESVLDKKIKKRERKSRTKSRDQDGMKTPPVSRENMATDDSLSQSQGESQSTDVQKTDFEKVTLDPIPESLLKAATEEEFDFTAEKDFSRTISEMEEEEEKVEEIPPPFNDLRSIDLSYNKIEEEEGILAVAAWPMLAELLIHNNPLTMRHSGDPPLLKRFLKERLGIDIVRKKPGEIEKPHIQVQAQPSRKVKTLIPKVPKIGVDQLLAIEAAKPASERSTSRRSASVKSNVSERPKSHVSDRMSSLSSASKPLPPITPDRQSDAYSDDIFEEGSPTTPSEAWSEKKKATFEGEAFFMTQLDDVQPDGTTETKPAAEEKQASPVPRPPTAEKKMKHRKHRERVPSRYKGYEVLLDAQDEPDVVLPKDMQGSVRALQYTLNHPLVFRDPVAQLEKPQASFVPYQKPQAAASFIPKSHSEKVAETLDAVKNRQVVVQASLTDAITNKQYQKQFPEAQKLLNEIQSKYNSVRLDSLKDAKEIRHLVKATINTHKPPPSKSRESRKTNVEPAK